MNNQINYDNKEYTYQPIDEFIWQKNRDEKYTELIR